MNPKNYFVTMLIGALLFSSSAFSGNNQVIISATCNDENCVALGYGDNKLPSLFNSKDGGKSWQLNTSVHFPANQNPSNFLNAITYFNHRFYISTDDGFRPYLLNSDDNGITWKLANVRSIIFYGEKSITLSEVTCHHNTCFIFGFTPPRNDRPYYQAFILDSDNGDVWIKNGRLDYSAGFVFSKIGHTDKTWILVGKESNINNAFDNELPAIIVNNMNGMGWKSARINIPTSLHGQLHDVNCKINTCTAVGEYFDPNKVSHQLILESSDAGNTWKQISIGGTK